MRLVYIAGAYTAPTAWGIAENVRVAERGAREVAARGCMPVTPHLLSGAFGSDQTDEFWYEGTLAVMRRCDGVLAIPGWEESKGAKAEIEEADRIGLRVLYGQTEIMLGTGRSRPVIYGLTAWAHGEGGA